MARAYWETLPTDEGAHFDREVRLDGAKLPPIVTWGSSPEDVVAVTGVVPDPDLIEDETRARLEVAGAANTWASRPARRSPTSSSTASSSARAPTAASRICAPRRRSSRAGTSTSNLNAMVVPGSGLVKEQAEAEGLDRIFKAAGFEWREPGCSMCLAMNADKLQPEERCASTSNRNFEGRQGYKGRTHLVSPAMAAAAAIAGHFVDIRELALARSDGPAVTGPSVLPCFSRGTSSGSCCLRTRRARSWQNTRPAGIRTGAPPW